MFSKHTAMLSLFFLCSLLKFFQFGGEETFPVALEAENFQFSERQEKFLWRQIKNLQKKITSLAKYFARTERNDDVEHGVKTLNPRFS